MTLCLGVNLTKLFSTNEDLISNKLECLSLASLYTLLYVCERELSLPEWSKLSDVSLLGRLLALLGNIKLGGKAFQGQTL
jgi:hypothetical protein